MPLQKQTIDVPIFGGLEGKTNQALLKPGQAHGLTNVVLDETGAVKKRNGFDALSSLANGSSVSGGTNVYGFGKRMLVQGTDELYEYSPTVAAWQDRRRLAPISTAKREMGSGSATNNYYPSLAKNGNYLCWVNNQYTGTSPEPNWAVEDYATGAKIAAGRMSLSGTGGTIIRALPINTGGGARRFFFLGVEGDTLGSRTISQGILDPTATTITSPSMTNIVTNGEEADACAVGTTAVCVAYWRASTPNVINLALYDATGTATTTTTFAATPTSIGVQYFTIGGTSYICVVYYDSGASELRYSLRNPSTLGQVLAPTTIAAGVGGSIPTCIDDTNSSNGIWFIWQSATSLVAKHRKMSTAGAAITSTDSIYNVELASKAFKFNGKAHVWVSYDEPVNATSPGLNTGYYLLSQPFALSATKAPMQAVFMKDFALYEQGSNFPRADVVGVSSSNFITPFIRVDGSTEGSTTNTLVRKSVVAADVNMASSGLPRASIGEYNLIATGFLAHVEEPLGPNNGAVELGFMTPPTISTLTDSNTGGGALAAGSTYGYAVVWEYLDPAGNVHQSEPSYDSITIGGGNNTVTLVIASLTMTLKYYGVKAIVYRTMAGDTTYYRTTATADNNPAASTISIVDPGDTSSLSGLTEILYTDGGILNNMAPPQPATIAAGNGRIFAVSADDPTQIWFSKTIETGTGIAFAGENIYVTKEGGNCTAIVEQDGNVITWKDQQIRVFGGDGPNAAGVGSFSLDRRIADNVGNLDGVPICKTENGTYFQSRRGIWFLDRSLQASYIGAPVEDVTTTSIIQAVSARDWQRAYFLVNSGATVLVHDSFHNMWMTWATANQSSVDMAEVDGKLSVLGGNVIDQENRATWIDESNTSYSMVAKTGWFNLAGLQGYQRLYWIGIMVEVETHCTVRVKIYNDYDDASVIQTINIDTSTAGASLGYTLPIRIKPQYQKCRSIMVSVEDRSGTGTQQNIKWTALTYTVGVIGGIGRLGSTRSA